MPGLGRGGMLPGLGRGPRSPPGAGRSPRGPGAGRSPPGRCGRSPPGRGPRGAGGVGEPPPPTPNGLLPGRGVRGPGLGACRFGGTTAPPDWPPAAGVWVCLGCCCGRAAGSAGACGGAADAAAGAWVCSAGRLVLPGAGAPGRGPGRAPGAVCLVGGAVWAGAGLLAGRAGGAAGADAVWRCTPAALGAGAAGRVDSRLPPDRLLRPPLPLSCLGKESRNRRATGASTVEDADFTNSPRSFSLASTSLLVTPSSLASSCTRALPATALLI